MLLFLLVALAAAVYSSVGHGGASAYLAILSLFGVPPAEMSTSALLLNVLVAGVATVTYARAGHLSPRLVWPFAITSIPSAYLGGWLRVSPRAYTLLLGAALLAAAVRLWWTPSERAPRPVALPVALASGAGIGILSGIVGIGGGIFLSPLMILAGWAGAKQTAAASAVFIVVNSIAALAGRVARGTFVVGDMGPLVVAALLGGLVGSRIGAHRLLPEQVRRVLALTLLFVAIKNLLLWLNP